MQKAANEYNNEHCFLKEAIISSINLQWESTIIYVLVKRIWPALLLWKSTLLRSFTTISSELIICIGFYFPGFPGLFPRICFITVSLASGISFLHSSVRETKHAFYVVEFQRGIERKFFLLFKKEETFFLSEINASKASQPMHSKTIIHLLQSWKLKLNKWWHLWDAHLWTPNTFVTQKIEEKNMPLLRLVCLLETRKIITLVFFICPPTTSISVFFTTVIMSQWSPLSPILPLSRPPCQSASLGNSNSH